MTPNDRIVGGVYANAWLLMRLMGRYYYFYLLDDDFYYITVSKTFFEQ